VGGGRRAAEVLSSFPSLCQGSRPTGPDPGRRRRAAFGRSAVLLRALTRSATGSTSKTVRSLRSELARSSIVSGPTTRARSRWVTVMLRLNRAGVRQHATRSRCPNLQEAVVERTTAVVRARVAQAARRSCHRCFRPLNSGAARSASRGWLTLRCHACDPKTPDGPESRPLRATAARLLLPDAFEQFAEGRCSLGNRLLGPGQLEVKVAAGVFYDGAEKAIAGLR
jgi:hypothetical protein